MTGAEAGPETGARRLVAEARALVGTRFRPQGRSRHGLDCVGVVVVAAGRAGISLGDRRDYALRPHSGAAVRRLLEPAGLIEIGIDEAKAGDILLMQPVSDQVHFGLLTEGGIIEAHAGLGRVVERPRRPDDAVLAAFRLPWETR